MPVQVFGAFQKVKGGTCPGADGIPSEVWKKLTLDKTICAWIADLFTAFIRQGIYPADLRHAMVIALAKATGGYRPISLLSTFSKGFERILTEYIRGALPLRADQFGSKAGHSCQEALLRVLHGSSQALHVNPTGAQDRA